MECGDEDWFDTNRSGRSESQLIRENLEQLVEQSTADSSAGDDDLNAARIAEQEQELANYCFEALREALLPG